MTLGPNGATSMEGNEGARNGPVKGLLRYALNRREENEQE